MAKLNFQHHYSSLQCHIIILKLVLGAQEGCFINGVKCCYLIFFVETKLFFQAFI